MAKEKIKSEPDWEATKRQSILNAAISEFCNGYSKASTDAIVKTAGVSKGLLFHYFGSKKNLLLSTYDYAVKTVMAEFYDLINLEERDILERWKQIALLKMDLIQMHPMIFNFIAQASLPDGEEISGKMQQDQLTGEIDLKMFNNIDHTLFRQDIDVGAAIRVILFTIEGYAQKADPNKSAEDYYGDYSRYLSDLHRYIRLFKMSFYK